MKVYVHDIKWDTDGDNDLLKELPTESILQFDMLEEEIDEDFISDYISDLTGFCHFGFKYEIIE